MARQASSIIFTFVFYSPNSMVASIRIARYLSERLGLPVVDNRNIGDYEGQKLDVLYIVNGAYAFCKCLPELADLIRTAHRVVWVQNDYTIVPPKSTSAAESPFRAAWRERREAGLPEAVYWSTCHDWSRLPGSSYVNWNQLTFDPVYNEKMITARRKTASDDLLYYGSYRSDAGVTKAGKPYEGKNGRDAAFRAYFADPRVPITISSPLPRRTGASHFRTKFTSPKITHQEQITGNLYNEIGQHGLGLYIDDKMSNERFHSPANRFYEMLSAGLPMVFSPTCVAMLDRAGLDVRDFVAISAHLPDRMRDREEIGKEQRRRWVGDDPGRFARKLEEQVSDALEKLS